MDMERNLKISLPVAVEYLRGLLPDVDWVVKFMESEGGWFRLPPRMVAAIRSLNIGTYVELYANENAPGLTVLFRRLTCCFAARPHSPKHANTRPKRYVFATF